MRLMMAGSSRKSMRPRSRLQGQICGATWTVACRTSLQRTLHQVWSPEPFDVVVTEAFNLQDGSLSDLFSGNAALHTVSEAFTHCSVPEHLSCKWATCPQRQLYHVQSLRHSEISAVLQHILARFSACVTFLCRTLHQVWSLRHQCLLYYYCMDVASTWQCLLLSRWISEGTRSGCTRQ